MACAERRRLLQWPRPKPWWGAALASALGALAPTVSCDGSPALQLCGQIPEGGCPIGKGGTCEDRSCAALYDCVDGSWTRVEQCPAQGGAGGGAGGVGGAPNGGAAGESVGGAGGCVHATIDHEGEVSGCTPELQLPDCTVDVAESCQPCLTECVDFYLCTAGGWSTVAYCDDDANLVVEP